MSFQAVTRFAARPARSTSTANNIAVSAKRPVCGCRQRGERKGVDLIPAHYELESHTMNSTNLSDQCESPFDLTDEDVQVREELMNPESSSYHSAFDFHIRNLRNCVDQARSGDEKHLRGIQLCAQAVYETAFRMVTLKHNSLARVVLEEFRKAEQLSENFEYIRQRSESIRKALIQIR